MLSPRTDVSRPITDRVKESLFSVLYKYDLPDGKMVADLFCGVGSLGLEALSRGAEFVTFVEKNLKIVAILEKNIEKAGFAGESKVIRANAFKIGAPPAAAAAGISNLQRYDLIFVDPPYSTTRQTKEGSPCPSEGRGSPLSGLFALLSKQSAADGIVVVRTEWRTELLSAGHLTVERYSCFQTIERRRWGTMVVTILQRRSK